MKRHPISNTAKRMENDLQRLARVMSRDWAVNVMFSGNMCSTDGDTIYLPYNSEYIDKDRRLIHGILDHETAHVAEENSERSLGNETMIQIMRSEKNKSLRFLINCVEDIRIEKKYASKYPGVAENLLAVNKNSMKLLYENKERRSNFWDMLGCLIIARANELDYGWCPKAVLEYLPKIESDIMSSLTIEHSYQSRDLARLIYDKVKEDHEDQSNKEKSSDESDESDGSDGSEFGEDSVGGNGGNTAVMSPLQDASLDDINSASRDQLQDMSKEDISRSKRYVPHQNSLNLDRWIKPDGGDAHEYKVGLEDVRSQIGALRTKVLSLISTMQKSRIAGDKESGRIDSASLHSIKTGNKSVFSDVVRGLDLDAAVSILIDLSGSMGLRQIGHKSWYAHRSAIALSELFDSLKVPFEIIGFFNSTHRRYNYTQKEIADGERGVGPQCREPFDFVVFKEYCEKLSRCKHRFSAIQGGFGCNTDGEAVRAVGKRLAVRSELSKFLFVISDGMPVAMGSNPALVRGDLCNAVSELTKVGIDVFALGMLTDAVSSFYNKDTGASSAEITNLNEFARIVYTTMKDKLIKSMRK